MKLKPAKPTNQLTPRQLQILKTIAEFQASRCYSPTIAELASELGISRSTVFEHIVGLRKKGRLRVCPGKARSLKLTSKAQELLKVLADHNSNAFSELPGETSFCPKIAQAKPPGISLAGKVAAGSPIEAIENKERLSLSSHFGGDDTFALEVAGDSMLGDDIHNGDYVICLRSAVADEGQLVIAIINGEEATLKRFYKEKSCVRLQPANDNYQPIYSDNCRIEAVVVGLVRKF